MSSMLYNKLKEEFAKSIIPIHQLDKQYIKELTNSPNITDNYATNLLNRLIHDEEIKTKNIFIDNIKNKLTTEEWDFILDNKEYIYDRENFLKPIAPPIDK